MKRNLFIVVEGIDGTGKTTVCNALCKVLGAEYAYSVSPIFAPLRPHIDRRNNPELRFLFYISSLVAFQETIKEQLQKRSIVIDRYIDSTVFHHKAMGANVAIVNLELLPIAAPDFVFALTVSEDTRIARLRQRDNVTDQDAQSIAALAPTLSLLFSERDNYFLGSRTHFVNNNQDIDQTMNQITDVHSERNSAYDR